MPVGGKIKVYYKVDLRVRLNAFRRTVQEGFTASAF